MTDIYIRRERPSKRPIFIALGVIVALVIGIGVYKIKTRGTGGTPSFESLIESPLAIEEASAPDPQPEPLTSLPPESEAEPEDDTPEEAERDEPSEAPGQSTNSSAAGNAAGMLSRARQLAAEGQLLAARDMGLDILAGHPDPAIRRATEQLLSKLNVELVFTPRAMPQKVEYVVQPGDSLDRIAKKFRTTVSMLQKGNGITGHLIHPGDRLRILQGDFEVTIDKTDNELLVYFEDRFFKRYRVGTGEYGKTPVGTFEITEKIPQPTWWHPDGKTIPYGHPDNLLGTHWLSLDIPGYGIHGTWEPETIGKQSSAGCIRLLNEDIQELYTLLPIGTPVTIED